MIRFTANVRSAKAVTDDSITTSSVGIPVSLNLASDFDGLAKTVVFKAGAAAVDVALVGDANSTTVPPDVLTEKGKYLSIGIYAADGEENIVIPTVWATVGMIHEGAVPSGIDPSGPTPSWAAQVQQTAEDAEEAAETAGREVNNVIQSSGFRWYENLAVPSVTLPYDISVTSSSASTVVWSSVDKNAGPAFPVKAGKYYVQIFKYRYNADDTCPNGSAITVQQLKNASWSNIGTKVAGFGYYTKTKVGNSTMTGVFITKITSDYNTARIRLGVTGAGTSSHTIGIKVLNSLVLELDTFEDAMRVGYEVFGMDNTYAFSNDGFGVFTQEHSADIICWGDSLTSGAGGDGTSYPSVLATELGLNVWNCGVGGEDANTIAARQGGNNILIPAGAINGSYATLTDIFGATVAPLVQGTGLATGSRIIINGEYCDLALSSGNYVISGYTQGSSAMPLLGKFAGAYFDGGIVVIFVGQNGSTVGSDTTVESRKTIIDSMISHIGHERYVVLGLSSGGEELRAADDAAMLAHYGAKFFPTRKMLVNYGLALMNITPTEQDNTDIGNGKVPTSLRSDGTHLNADGYTALGKLLADKIRSLGYV